MLTASDLAQWFEATAAEHPTFRATTSDEWKGRNSIPALVWRAPDGREALVGFVEARGKVRFAFNAARGKPPNQLLPLQEVLSPSDFERVIGVLRGMGLAYPNDDPHGRLSRGRQLDSLSAEAFEAGYERLVAALLEVESSTGEASSQFEFDFSPEPRPEASIEVFPARRETDLHLAWRYQLPFPLAAAYKAVRLQTDVRNRFLLSLRLGQEILRFLALVGLADALTRNPAPKRVAKWFGYLAKPSVASFLVLIESTTKGRGPNDTPFLSELPAVLAAPEWRQHTNRLRELRNRHLHDLDLPALGLDFVQESLAELEPLLDYLLAQLAFLSRYTMGFFQAGESLSLRRHQYSWIPCQGLEEQGEPRLVESETQFFDSVYLLDPQGRIGLELSPFFEFRRLESEPRLVFFDRLEAGEAVFRHPSRRGELRGDLSLPRTRRRRLDFERFRDTPQEWPRRVDLELRGRAREAVTRLARYGQRVGGRYRILGPLGSGGMGEVYEAEDQLLRRRVAIKRLTPGSGSLETQRMRFLREARALATIRDPRVVAVHDYVDQEGEQPAIVMELAAGEDLQSRLDREGPFPADEAVEITRETLRALDAVHAKQLVHRDVKPGNIVIGEQGLCLVDFGIVLDDRKTRLTRHRGIGTQGYVDPAGADSPASDLYAVGCLLHALLIGEPPARGRVDSSVPAPLQSVIETALREDPAQRFASAKAMREALEACASQPGSQPRARHDARFALWKEGASMPTRVFADLSTARSEAGRLSQRQRERYDVYERLDGVDGRILFSAVPPEEARLRYSLWREDAAQASRVFGDRDRAEQEARRLRDRKDRTYYVYARLNGEDGDLVYTAAAAEDEEEEDEASAVRYALWREGGSNATKVFADYDEAREEADRLSARKNLTYWVYAREDGVDEEILYIADPAEADELHVRYSLWREGGSMATKIFDDLAEAESEAQRLSEKKGLTYRIYERVAGEERSLLVTVDPPDDEDDDDEEPVRYSLWREGGTNATKVFGDLRAAKREADRLSERKMVPYLVYERVSGDDGDLLYEAEPPEIRYSVWKKGATRPTKVVESKREARELAQDFADRKGKTYEVRLRKNGEDGKRVFTARPR